MRNKNISHTSNAIVASQYFAEFFVNEARKSDHHFKDAKTEDQYVIYNYDASFTGLKGSSFEQSYMFPIDVDYDHGSTKSDSNGIHCSILSFALNILLLKLLFWIYFFLFQFCQDSMH